MNIADIFEEYATTRSHHPAIEDDARVITYGELAPALDAAARNLQAAGIAPGDMVAVMLEDSADHLIILCALARAGACIYSLGPNLSASGLTDRLDRVTVKAVITRNRPGPAREAICLRPEAICQPAAAAFERPDISGDHPLLYNQSSGTTGRPKSFFRSHDEFVIWARRYTNPQGWRADDRCFCLTRRRHRLATHRIWQRGHRLRGFGIKIGAQGTAALLRPTDGRIQSSGSYCRGFGNAQKIPWEKS